MPGAEVREALDVLGLRGRLVLGGSPNASDRPKRLGERGDGTETF